MYLPVLLCMHSVFKLNSHLNFNIFDFQTFIVRSKCKLGEFRLDNNVPNCPKNGYVNS